MNRAGIFTTTAAWSLVVIAATGTRAQSQETASVAAPPPQSTVSTAIERFVRASGRDVPEAPVPPPIDPIALPTEPPADPAPPARPAREPGPTPLGPGLQPLPATPYRAGAPSATAVLKPAPLMPGDLQFPINLAAALRLSDARPLVVAAAQAGVWVAEAELTRAKVLWVPTFKFSVAYLRHDGGGPDFNKGIMTAPSVNFFQVAPSMTQYLNLTDAIFQPLAARQALNSRHYDVQAAKNDALYDTATAYFHVHQARGTYAGHLYTVERGRELVHKIEILSRDLVPRVEVDRARNLLAELEQRSARARQDWRVRSADLTQVLRLDPRAVVDPLEHDHTQITLIDPAKPLDELMAVALHNRPEVGSRIALVQAREYDVRREKSRPVLPLVLLNGFQTPGGMAPQGGIFGIGPNDSLNQFRGRVDVGIQLMWQLEAFGIGNLARIKQQRGRQSQSIIDLRRTQDGIAADVNRAVARLQSAAVRVMQADRALRTGLVSFNGQLQGLGQTKRFGDVLELIYRPQEVIFSLDRLSQTFSDYFTTVAEYNIAQFDLFHAMGYPARELAELRPAGDPIPVEINRPAPLPPVGNGPPPAAR